MFIHVYMLLYFYVNCLTYSACLFMTLTTVIEEPNDND